MSNILDRIENQLKTFVEEKLTRLFSSENDKSLATMFLSIIIQNAVETAPDRLTSPDLFFLVVPQVEVEGWMEKKSLLDEIANEIYVHITETGMAMNNYPRIVIEASDDPHQKLPLINAFVTPLSDPLVNTTAFVIQDEDLPDVSLPPNALIIVNGDLTFHLQNPIINIGRKSTADLVIDDPQVSREHLQLRARDGRYILFDLGSLGGTFINNKSIQVSTLVSGDVIRIGNTNLIYSDEGKMSTTTNPMQSSTTKKENE